MKKLKTVGIVAIIIIAILSALVLVLLGGSDFTVYPEEKASRWVCTNPHIEIHYSADSFGSYLEWEGEKVPIFVGLHASAINVYRQEPGQTELREDDILFMGYWYYEGETMVVEIDTDHFFHNAHTELVFVPQE
jgi:hypothetical protein